MYNKVGLIKCNVKNRRSNALIKSSPPINNNNDIPSDPNKTRIIKGNIIEDNVLINSIQLSFNFIVLENNEVVFMVTE